MGYGVSSPEVQRLEHHKISLPCQILLPPERTCFGSARLHKVPGCRHTIITALEDPHRQDNQEVKQYVGLPTSESEILQ